MLHVLMILEDVLLNATRHQPHDDSDMGPNIAEAPDNSDEKLWKVMLCDSFAGQSTVRHWSDAELSAVVALGIGGDEIAGADILYPIAEKACEGLPRELRPIP